MYLFGGTGVNNYFEQIEKLSNLYNKILNPEYMDIVERYYNSIGNIDIDKFYNNAMIESIERQNQLIEKMNNNPLEKYIRNFEALSEATSSIITTFENYNIDSLINALDNMMNINKHPFFEQFSNMSTGINKLSVGIGNLAYECGIASIYKDDIKDDEREDIEKTDSKIISKILCPDSKKSKESAIIALSPVNDKILKYLSENPEEFYKLGDTDFEIVMAKIYSKLGYDVQRTQATRDGGKDIIIRKPEILGDFIYYVECKKYAPGRKIGVGIIRNLIGTVNTDRINGAILATTSFFSRDARKYVLDNQLNYQIKMQDYNEIQNLLNQVIF